MSELIKRYVVAVQRREQHEGVTEDDVNEIKHDISSLRYELLEVLSLNGMKLPSSSKSRRSSRRGENNT
jgi:transient receptor potential cation channel subfamily C member 4